MVKLKEIEAMKTYVEKCTAAMTWLESRGIEYEEKNEQMHYNFMRYIERLEEQVKPMTWTTTKPSKPGWYWRKSHGIEHLKKIICIDEEDIAMDFNMFNPGGEWAGPIEEPEEAK